MVINQVAVQRKHNVVHENKVRKCEVLAEGFNV